MLKLLINGGMFAGEGVYCADAGEIIGLPVMCSFEASQSGTKINIQGHYRHHSGSAKHQFSAELRYASESYYALSLSGIDATLGELDGFVSISESGMLVAASADGGRTQVSQHWNELQADYSFRVHGLVLRPDRDPLKFDLTIGSVDPMAAKSNVVSLGESGK